MNLFSRNIGLISEIEQLSLSNSHVLICGVGGMGSICTEMLVRMGIGELTIIDPDKMEDSNSNRLIHCNQDNIGKFKVDVFKEEFLKINPKLKINFFNKQVDLDTIHEVLTESVDIVVNGMDEFFPSLILERNARKMNKIIVDAWITPFASVFVMKPEDPHWEEFLGLPTLGKELENITQEDLDLNLKKEISYTFSHFTPEDYVQKEVVSKVLKKEIPRPSLAPVVWLSGGLLANEVFKIICGYPHTDYKGIFLDQYNYKIKRGNL